MQLSPLITFLLTSIALLNLGLPAMAQDSAHCGEKEVRDPISAVNLAGLMMPVGPSLWNGVPENKTCVQDPQDPYDPGARIAQGKYRGRCIDASTVRAPVILRDDANEIDIANFYHDGKFWTAKIPKNAVQSLIYQGVPILKILYGA